MISTKTRSKEREIMDDFSLEGAHLRENLDILATINKWLGGNHISLNGVKKLITNESRQQKIKIVDFRVKLSLCQRTIALNRGFLNT